MQQNMIKQNTMMPAKKSQRAPSEQGLQQPGATW
jgi:hypothetical protein